MKKLLSILFACVALIFDCFSQKVESFKVPAGSTVDDAVPYEKTHLFPEFQKCQIRYIDGKSSLAMINYDLLAQKVELISVKKDTGYLNINFSIRQFDFDNETLLNDEKFGIIEAGKDTTYPMLGFQKKIVVISVDAGSNNGYSSSVDPSTSNTTVRLSRYPGRRDVKEEMGNSNRLVKQEVTYFFIDRNHRVYPSQASNIYKILPRYKNEVRDYIKEEKIDFKEETDLKKLISFCQSL
jgi:hypothetical protein